MSRMWRMSLNLNFQTKSRQQNICASRLVPIWLGKTIEILSEPVPKGMDRISTGREEWINYSSMTK